MIKFFRNIRFKVISDNHLSRYLLYAIGEILLVVIGILIAVKINALYEVRKNIDKEKNYLTAILSNLDEDISALEVHSKIQEQAINYLRVLKLSFTVDQIRLDRQLMINAIQYQKKVIDFDPNRNIFDGMKSSGDIRLISSPDLLSSLQRYYMQSEAVVKSEVQNNFIIEQHHMRIFTDLINMSSLDNDEFGNNWAQKMYEKDLSFFDSDINSPLIKEFANRVSDLIFLRTQIMNRELDLRTMALRRKETIIEYLADPKKEEIQPFQVPFSSNQFKTSIPQNYTPTTKETLSEFKGTYNLSAPNYDKDTEIRFKISEQNSMDDAQEITDLIINIENDHLIVSFRNEFSHCYYNLGEDAFKRAMSFLFNNQKSKGTIKFIRNEDGKVSGLTLNDLDYLNFSYTRTYKKL